MDSYPGSDSTQQYELRLHLCSTKTREVLGNPNLTAETFLETMGFASCGSREIRMLEAYIDWSKS